MKIQYLGHSGFLLESGGARVAVDPFLNGNPNAPMAAKELKADFVVVTHAHGDHFADGLELARRGATLISTHEIATYAQAKGAAAHGMHIGGGRDFPFGRVKLTIAHHGSSVAESDGPRTLGPACGALIAMGGLTVYHTGDTGLFLDMKLIGETSDVAVMLVPIGDNYTMGPDDAVRAVEFVQPRLAIPMHYGTFDVIEVDPHDFARRLESRGRDCRVLAPGEALEV